jgi:hypothetical protein
MTDQKPQDDSKTDDRSSAILSTAQDVRPLEEDVDPKSGHVSHNDPLADPKGREELTEEQSRLVASLAQDIRPLENNPDD